MRPSLQALMKKLKGKTVFIIGGGPSANNVDFNLLQSETVVCVNDAYRDFPDAAMIYWLDSVWAAENHDTLMLHDCKLKFTAKRHSRVRPNKEDPTSDGGYCLQQTGDFGYDPDVNCLMGNNSGVHALNIVVNMKPKRVVLIGYDMRRVDRVSHYHKQRRPYVGDDIYSTKFVPSMEALAKGMKEHQCKVEIINATPDSAVRCFKFGDYTDFLSD